MGTCAFLRVGQPSPRSKRVQAELASIEAAPRPRHVLLLLLHGLLLLQHRRLLLAWLRLHGCSMRGRLASSRRRRRRQADGLRAAQRRHGRRVGRGCIRQLLQLARELDRVVLALRGLGRGRRMFCSKHAEFKLAGRCGAPRAPAAPSPAVCS